MLKKYIRPCFLIAALAASSCAKTPNAIAPIAPPPSAYRGMSCRELGSELRSVVAKLEVASARQTQAAQNDAAGVFLLGVPVASLAGADMEAEVASLKGQKLALDDTVARRCS